MTDEELAEMLKLVSRLDEDVQVLMEPGDVIWLINEVQRARRDRRGGDVEFMGFKIPA